MSAASNTQEPLLSAIKELVAADEAYSRALSASGMADVSALTEKAANRLSDAAHRRREALKGARAAIAKATGSAT
jgi:hypothetical protein